MANEPDYRNGKDQPQPDISLGRDRQISKKCNTYVDDGSGSGIVKQ
jgi:hypothetical protein